MATLQQVRTIISSVCTPPASQSIRDFAGHRVIKLHISGKPALQLVKALQQSEIQFTAFGNNRRLRFHSVSSLQGQYQVARGNPDIDIQHINVYYTSQR